MIITQNSDPIPTSNETEQLLSLLKAKGCKFPLKQGLTLTPADKGSDRTNLSINHDQIFDD